MKSKCFSLKYDVDKGWCILFPISIIVIVTCALPLLSLIFCITWSLLYYFENTVSTNCKIWNFLPSISSAIGNNLPQYVIWCSAITLHMPARFFVIFLYYNFNTKLLNIQNKYFAKMAVLLNLIENLSLLGLSYISSTKAYKYHKNFFLLFVVSSELYMLLACLMHKYASKCNSLGKLEILSFYMKILLLVVNVLSFVLALYFFMRHHLYCEPGVYSLFAFFELLLIFSNIGFHSIATIDFKDQYIGVTKRGIEISVNMSS